MVMIQFYEQWNRKGFHILLVVQIKSVVTFQLLLWAIEIDVKIVFQKQEAN